MKKTKAELEKLKQKPVIVPQIIKPPDPQKWDDIKRVIEVLQQAMVNDWNWSSNVRCKYIDVHIDMRGHSCRIKDREGIVITIEKLKFQYGLK